MSESVESKGLCSNVGNIGRDRGCDRGVRGIFDKDTSLLFFFLLLVIIFCNCGIFGKENGSELLFFFLLLVVLFGGGRFFGL